MNDFSMILFAQDVAGGSFGDLVQGFFRGIPHFVSFARKHWQFCLVHFLEFAIWGAWFVVLGNFLDARGFSRQQIGRIYSTIPIGSIVSPLFIGLVADKYVNTEILIGVSHLLGAVLLFVMARTSNPRPFYWATFVYALVFAPTLSLVNSVVFAHEQDIFAGDLQFPWIRVFGTLGWIAAGLAHPLILRKGEPMSERPVLLACALSVVLGLFAFTLPETLPAAQLEQQTAAAEEADEDTGEVVDSEQSVSVWRGAVTMLTRHPVFFGVSFVTAMAMGLYFAFTALYLEQKGVPTNVVGPVMTIGQWIEIFFMLTLPWFLGGSENPYMNRVLIVGVCAWALRFGLFAVGRPLPLVLLGVAIHGICFDFFFAAGMMNTDDIAPRGLTATAQQLYGFLVYGLGMYLGSEASGWLNQRFTSNEAGDDGTVQPTTRWRFFWGVPCLVITMSAILFWLSSR